MTLSSNFPDTIHDSAPITILQLRNGIQQNIPSGERKRRDKTCIRAKPGNTEIPQTRHIQGISKMDRSPIKMLVIRGNTRKDTIRAFFMFSVQADFSSPSLVKAPLRAWGWVREGQRSNTLYHASGCGASDFGAAPCPACVGTPQAQGGVRREGGAQDNTYARNLLRAQALHRGIKSLHASPPGLLPSFLNK